MAKKDDVQKAQDALTKAEADQAALPADAPQDAKDGAAQAVQSAQEALTQAQGEQAPARPQDETVPGGRYLLSDGETYVNAEGNRI